MVGSEEIRIKTALKLQNGFVKLINYLFVIKVTTGGFTVAEGIPPIIPLQIIV